MISEHFFLDAAERGAHRRDLRDDIDAIAVLVDHFGQAANLALDPAQAFLAGCLDVFSHMAYIPLQGMGCKWAVAESSMTKAENANVGAAKDSVCCGGHNHSGDGRAHSHGS